MELGDILLLFFQNSEIVKELNHKTFQLDRTKINYNWILQHYSLSNYSLQHYSSRAFLLYVFLYV